MDFSIWLFLLIITKLVVYTTSFLAIGGAGFLALFHDVENGISAVIRRLIYICAALAILSSIGFLLVQSGYIVEDGLAGMFDVEMLQIFLEENMGSSLYMRIFAMILLILLVMFLPYQKLFIAVPIVLTSTSFALVGHATGDYQIYTSILLTVHLLAVGFWVGALWPLYLSANQPSGAAMLAQFGKIASFVVPLLIVVGLLFGIYIVGSFAALFNSSYGISLLIKVAIVGVLLGLATLNKILFVPYIAAQRPKAVQWLRLTIAVEAVAFLAIFTVTAALTTIMTLPE
ncbi:MAG: CopD family protein [Alphaproteobacteria bacterium]|nr:CopD family protein [Alphaproteobacteria bacterium]